MTVTVEIIQQRTDNHYSDGVEKLESLPEKHDEITLDEEKHVVWGIEEHSDPTKVYVMPKDYYERHYGSGPSRLAIVGALILLPIAVILKGYWLLKQQYEKLKGMLP
jgi:hypothetical protein